MKHEFNIRELSRKDIPHMVSLVDSIYKIKKNSEYFLWHCFNNIHPVVMMGCFYKREFVGMFGVHKRPLSNGLICGQAKSMNISFAWRHKGIFKMLGEMAFGHFDDIDIICVFANSNAAVPCEKSFGMKTIGNIKMMVKHSFEMIRDCSLRCAPIKRDTLFKELYEYRENVVGFKADSEYRSWRYGANPLYSYYILELDTGEYTVAKLFMDPITKKRFGDIVDIECANDSDKLKKLYLGTCRHLRDFGANAITTWATPGSDHRRVLEEIGFRDDVIISYFGFKAIKSEHEYLSDFSRWHLKQADSENY